MIIISYKNYNNFIFVLAALKTILHNILTEDKNLRTYRRSISFGQNIKKDLIPLLIHAKEDATIELLIRILVNLTIPIECLLSVDVISKTDFGRHTVFEINNLLATTKVAFTDHRATRVIIDNLKKNMHLDQKVNLTLEQCTNIGNSLLLMRNILHIPEENSGIQNQILWNIFSQGMDKVLIKLMIIPDAVSILKILLLLCSSCNSRVSEGFTCEKMCTINIIICTLCAVCIAGTSATLRTGSMLR